MVLPALTYLTFALLATGGLFAILRYHHGTRPALAWSAALLLAFAVLAALVVWVVETGGA